MLIYFQVEKYVIETYDDGSFLGWILTQVPGIVYAIIVYVMNVGYAYIAYILTEWGNYVLLFVNMILLCLFVQIYFLYN